MKVPSSNYSTRVRKRRNNCYTCPVQSQLYRPETAQPLHSVWPFEANRVSPFPLRFTCNMRSHQRQCEQITTHMVALRWSTHACWLGPYPASKQLQQAAICHHPQNAGLHHPVLLPIPPLQSAPLTPNLIQHRRLHCALLPPQLPAPSTTARCAIPQPPPRTPLR